MQTIDSGVSATRRRKRHGRDWPILSPIDPLIVHIVMFNCKRKKSPR